MDKVLRRLRLAFRNVLAFFAIVIVGWMGWRVWDQHRIDQFCAAAQPGTSLSQLPDLADQYGFGRHWVERGLKRKNEPEKRFFVPTNSSMGQTGCMIRHDGSVVASASVINY